ncbi:MAG: hypothetical protein O2985_02080 [Proteobacteria bacterium]|nr:hypothetical protein [Pseudomonadota bacterium]
MTETGRLETLTWISRQLQDLKMNVVDDVSQNRDDASGTPGGGFVAYSLKAVNGEPLRDTSITDLAITVENIKETDGYIALAIRCEELEWNVRIDPQFYSDAPNPSSIFRVIVDGWA